MLWHRRQLKSRLTHHASIQLQAISGKRLVAHDGQPTPFEFPPSMPKSSSLDRIRFALGLIRASAWYCIPATRRKPICLQSSSTPLADHRGADVVLAATVSAVRAEASVTELERLEDRHSRLVTAHFPSVRAHTDLIGSRVQKARFHATHARAHANAAVLIFMGETGDHLGSRLESLKRHAELAEQAQVLASDLVEISLILERGKKSRFPRRRI
ncbi:hypothetical protein BLA50215_03570 [Burkholderia lata]|nr:hypothetical protein BLA50215_03570 [Burkholderia lata]